jgi:nitroreductase
VEREVLLECLKVSQQAPTGSNAQSWRWLIVMDATKRKTIAELYRSGGRPHIEQVIRRRNERSAQDQRMIDSALYLYDNLERVPVHAIACMAGPIPDDAPHRIRATYYASIYPAVWSFMLALRSRGLGSVLTTLHLASEKEIGRALGIPEDVTQMALIPVAYTRGKTFRPAARPPVEKIVSWDTWGAGA